MVNNDGWDGLGSSTTGLPWTTYPERLQAAGVSWKVYQNMPDNFKNGLTRRFAGRVETGKDSVSDPAIGAV